MAMISAFLRDEGTFARAMRSSAWTIFGFVGSQGIRFGSNLILTRLLFPEAFGPKSPHAPGSSRTDTSRNATVGPNATVTPSETITLISRRDRPAPL